MFTLAILQHIDILHELLKSLTVVQIMNEIIRKITIVQLCLVCIYLYCPGVARLLGPEMHLYGL